MNQKLRVAELDFDTIKANLKEYLRSKEGFTDYDFEGSGLAILLDVLSYNTHYNAIIANMLSQEMFLDTAVKRQTVALHARRMGYLPRSARAARAFVTMEVFPNDAPPSLTLGKNAVFNSGGSTSFSFITNDAITITPNEQNRYIFENIPLYEGTRKTFRYIVTDTTSKFTIPDRLIDTSLLTVRIQKSTTNTDLTVFNYYENIADLEDNANVYYLRLNEFGQYDVYFGDGVISKEIEVGNVVILEYVVCSGEVPNGAGGFRFNDSVQGYTNLAVTTLNKAFGGSQEESSQSIRDNAYKRLLSQNRAVSESDYKAIINSILPIGDVSVWGGENNVPPVYGKVFISIVPIDVNAQFDDVTKQYILDQLKNKMTVTVTPELVDPDYLYVQINSTAYYDADRTANNAEQIKTLVYNKITSYVDANLNSFNKQIKHSNFVAMIDSTDKAITSNITKFVLKKRFDTQLNLNTSYRISFGNPIKQSSEIFQSISTDAFYVGETTNAVYIDDMNGILRLYSIVGGTKTILRNIGTVDYQKGVLNINPIIVTGYPTLDVFIRVTPLSNDILSLNNSVLIVNDADISVTALAEPRNKTNYVFTTS